MKIYKIALLVSIFVSAFSGIAADERERPGFQSSTTSCADPEARFLERESMKDVEAQLEDLWARLLQEGQCYENVQKNIRRHSLVTPGLLRSIRRFKKGSRNEDQLVRVFKNTIHENIESFNRERRENIHNLKQQIILSGKLSYKSQKEMCEFIDNHYCSVN